MVLKRLAGGSARTLAGIAGASLSVAVLGAPAAAETVRASYALSIIGISIGRADAAATIEPTGYKINIGLQLTGVASLVSNARGAATASGAIQNAVVLPNAYANTTANDVETRTVRMGLNAGTVRAVDISPPFLDMDGRVPVTAAHKSGVLDPLSALVMGVPTGEPLVGAAACNRTLPIYDGLVRFDVQLAYKGVRNVHAKGYTGPVSVCAARYRPVSGYKLDSQSTRYMTENKDLEVWLAPVAQAHVVVPYYVRIGTKSGALVIQAVDFFLSERRADAH